MPIYEFHCDNCKTITSRIFSIKDRPNKVKCECGKKAKLIISRSAIQADSLNDVKWLPSAIKTLQPDGEKPITTRGEYNKYLKRNGIVAKE